MTALSGAEHKQVAAHIAENHGTTPQKKGELTPPVIKDPAAHQAHITHLEASKTAQKEGKAISLHEHLGGEAPPASTTAPEVAPEASTAPEAPAPEVTHEEATAQAAELI